MIKYVFLSRRGIKLALKIKGAHFKRCLQVTEDIFIDDAILTSVTPTLYQR